MKPSTHYLKLVEWSEEDQSFVGQCPGVIGSCCHGDDEVKVYQDLSQIVDEWLELLQREGKPLPRPTIGKNIAKVLEAA